MKDAKRVESVLLVRDDNIGDAVLFSGALRHLRHKYGNQRIRLCVNRACRPLFEFCPYVDELIDIESLIPEWLRRIRKKHPLFDNSLTRVFDRVWRKLACRQQRTDVAICPVRSPWPLPFGIHGIVKVIPAKHKIGIAGDFSNQSPEQDAAAAAVYTERFQLPPERCWDHELEVTRDFLAYLGINGTLDDIWPEFWLSPEDLAWADSRIPSARGEVTLGISPASSVWWGRSYPPESYEPVFQALGDFRFRVVLLGTPGEIEFTRLIFRALKRCSNVTSIQDLVGQTPLRHLVAVLSKCDIIFAMETAAAHIGVALRKPTVVVMGGGHYGRFYPWGNPEMNRVAHLPMDCYRCEWRCRYSTIRCIQEIPPTTVADELRYILENAMGSQVSS